MSVPLNRATLAKVLGYLSSDKPGEVAAAANRAVAMLAAAGTDWGRVLAHADSQPDIATARNLAMVTAQLQRVSSENGDMAMLIAMLRAENERLKRENTREMARRVLAQANAKGAGFATLPDAAQAESLVDIPERLKRRPR